jgi:hypothetical protein
LFFPAGKYIVSGPINIPPFATLYGEGPQNSIIQMVASGGTGTCVAQTADNNNPPQTGINIGSNGAITPTDINIMNMAFETLDNTKNVFLVNSATNCIFRAVSFMGTETTSTLVSPTTETSGVVFASDVVTTSDILFDGCRFTGTVYGVTANQRTTGITINNSYFNILHEGIAFGTGTIVNGGPTGTRITNNMFDNIYSYGIIFHDVSLNATGYNIFYDVANFFLGTDNPATPVILFQGNNNVSIGDMFERTDVYAEQHPRIYTGSTLSISTTNGVQIQLGTKTVKSGQVATLEDNILPGNPYTIFTIDTTTAGPSFKIDYSTTRTGNLGGTGNVFGFRTGTIWVASNTDGNVSYMDDYTENYPIGVTLLATQIANTANVRIQYFSTVGSSASFNYSTSYFTS